MNSSLCAHRQVIRRALGLEDDDGSEDEALDRQLACLTVAAELFGDLEERIRPAVPEIGALVSCMYAAGARERFRQLFGHIPPEPEYECDDDPVDPGD